MATKAGNKTATLQFSAGTVDIPDIKAEPSHLVSKSFTLRQDTSNDVPTPMEEEDLLGENLIDYRATAEQSDMDVNVIMFFANCTIIGDDEPVIAQFDFGPKDVSFTKPKELVNHLKPLFVRGHIDGVPIAKMLVSGGTDVNLIPYVLYIKLGK
jgi:hypothetical protein